MKTFPVVVGGRVGLGKACQFGTMFEMRGRGGTEMPQFQFGIMKTEGGLYFSKMS